jgi:nitrogen regulatory protein PII
MKKTKAPVDEPESKPVVDVYNRAEVELTAFLKESDVREVLTALQDLVDARNAALDEAIRAVKSELQRSDKDRMVVEGIGAQKKYKTYYDTKHLAESLPVGQVKLFMTERVEYDLNVNALEQLVRQGEIDQDIVREAYHREEMSPSVMGGAPKPYVLPVLPMDDT